MNTVEREAIKEMFGDFLKDLHIDPEFLGPMIEDGVLTESMVDKIQAMPTQSEKIMQLLQVLPHCGQTAFSCFLEVLRKRSVWLAEKLQRKYKEKIDKQPQTTQDVNNDSHEDTNSDSEDNQHKLDRDEEAQVCEQIPTMTNLSKTNSDISKCSPNSSLRSAGAVHIHYQHNLNHLYINLKNKIRKHQKRELSFATPEPATFEMIEKLHDELFEQLTELQINVDQCYRAMGSVNDKVPLMSYIIKLKTGASELEKQLKSSEEQRNKYCEQIMKLDLRVRNQASQIQISEEKLRRISQTKTDQEMAFKNQIQQLEEKLKVAERKAAESDEATHVWQMNYIRLQKDNELLRREQHVFQPIHYNRSSAKENLQGILQISNQAKVPQTDRSEHHESASPRQSHTVENNAEKRQTDGQHTGKEKLKQARIHRRQSRHQDLSSLSYLSGSKIQNSITENKPSKELKSISKNEENISEIKQMKLSLQNATLGEKDNSDLSAKPYKLQVYIPTVSMQKTEEAEDVHINQNTQTPYGQFQVYNPTVNMQKADFEINGEQACKVTTPQLQSKQFKLQIPVVNMQRDEKELAEKDFHHRKGYKRQPLLKALSLRGLDNGNGTKPKRKNATNQ